MMQKPENVREKNTCGALFHQTNPNEHKKCPVVVVIIAHLLHGTASDYFVYTKQVKLPVC